MSIKVLSKEISELIAAGEVIERPSSVIKELVENSIDSGARHITVEIKNGGVTYMRVSDDGCGMSFDEVPTAFLRHATSKISGKDDLNNIITLGFRGEALASIAAVSKVDVMTKLRNETYGTLYKMEGSEEILCERGGCPDGTTIIIRDLFYNVPARRKFMKKDVAEANAVSQILRKIIMSRPDISFRFIRDNRQEFSSGGDGELYSAVYAVYGRDFVNDLLPLDYEYEGVRISGYVIKPLYAKNNRAFQNFFVNGRYVRSKLCSAAMENAYTNLLMQGKFPACVMMIDLPPSAMDVNMHPTKAEVRFADEKTISDAIYFAVKNTFMNNGLIYEYELKAHNDLTKAPDPPESVQGEFMFTPINKIEEREREISDTEQGDTLPHEETPQIKELPQGAAPQENVLRPEKENVPESDITQEKKLPERELQSSAPAESENACDNAEIPQKIEGFSYINSSSFKEEEKPAQSVWRAKPKLRVIGEVFGVYVIGETDDNTMIIIDKHAAHERIIFERLKSRNCRQYRQMLMSTVSVLLTEDEFSAVEANEELLADMGFSFDFSKRPCVVVTAVPTFVIDLDIEDIVSEIAENLRLFKHDPSSHVLDDLLHTVACKSAIKANDKNDIRELQALAEQVISDQRIRHCPHGRPVMFTMTKSNMERQFGRT